MSLLPKYQSDFNSVEYWESFFTKRLSSFEWYGSYFELCGILNRYVKAKDDILVIGCGNSNLSEQLYDTGCTKITNIDISKIVIKQMQDRNRQRDKMQWLEMDVAQMEMQDDSFSVVIDKGTLDAMMSGEQVGDQIDKMFGEISRVLRNGGRYVCISLAQDHIIKKMLDYFPSRNWLVRIHKVWTGGGIDDTTVQMPVFAFIFTKFQQMPAKILEVCLEDCVKPTRLQSEDDVVDFIKAQQYYAMVRNTLLKNEANVDMPPIELFSSEQVNIPRYKIYIIDLKDYNQSLKFGIFIIPHGREMEWLFASHQGRQQVAESAKFRRLAIVALSCDHEYNDGMKGIQNELSSRVMELAPANLPEDYKVPFLSIGGDSIGERHVRQRSQSKFSGSFVVEDYIGDNNVWFRQLVFENQGATVQSVTRLIHTQNTDGHKKKNSKQRQKHRNKVNVKSLVPDPSYLASQYSQIMVAALTSTIDTLQDKFKVLVVGLGGGTLSHHLLHVFKNCRITALELDPEIAKVATAWFGLGSDLYKSRLNIEVADGLKFIENLAKSNRNGTAERFDVVVLDANSNDITKSLQCPYEPFVEVEMIKYMSEILTEKGCLLLNMLSRDKVAKATVVERVQQVFHDVYHKRCGSDLNEILICLKAEKQEEISKKGQVNGVGEWMERAKEWERGYKGHSETLILSKLLENVVKIS